jgi:hypothetical protein
MLYETVGVENREAVLGNREQKRSRGEWCLLQGRRGGGVVHVCVKVNK